jgi:hypothetical protein
MNLRTTRRIAFAIAFSCTSCAPTIVRTGLPAGRVPELYDERWHHGFVFGLADASGAYEIEKICPRGWSEMRVETPVGLGIIQVATLGLYTPSRVTIVCAATSTDPPDPAGEEALPP